METLSYCQLMQRCCELAAERDAVNADNAYLRDQVICWARECDRITFTYTNKVTDAHQMEAEQELANTVPATDAYAASLRAEGVEMAIEAAKPLIAIEFQYSDFDACVSATYKFPESDLVGKIEMVEWMQDFAAQLRSKSEVQHD